MTQYISKNALVAEIRKRFDEYSNSILKHYDACTEARASELGKISIILDTLEVEEEPISNDIEAELVLYLKHKFNIPQEGNKLKTNGWRPSPYDILDIAKHFAQWQKEQMVKEVDLEGISKNYALNNSPWDDCMLEMQNAFKDGFELGLKAQKGE